jgi:uncharacterized membrane protein YebE (DUF533 family)
MNIKDLKNLDKEEILEMLGIDVTSTASTVLWTAGLVAVGAIVGAAAALLLTPKTGRELREAFGHHAKATADEIITTARAKVNEAQAERG